MYLTTFNVVTAVLMGLTVWLGITRLTSRLDSNWPLAYYFCAVVYLKVFEGSLDPYMMYAGTVSALLLRFEFMGGAFLTLIRAVESVVLAYVIYRCFALIMMW